MTDLAIVGHGPSMNGSRLGGLIDRHEEVCRVNPGAIPEAGQDYGTKTNIVAGRIDRADIYRESGEFWGVGTAVIGLAEKREWKKLAEYTKARAGVVFVPSEALLRWAERFREMRDQEKAKCISNGAAAIVCALERGYRTIRLYGFDSVKAGNNDADDARSLKANHDWAAEREILGEIAEAYGANIKFAD